MTDLHEFEERIGHSFRDQSLLRTALTHPSAVSEGICADSNQRLEFLGDAVLELVVSERLFGENPSVPEGRLTTSRAALVCGPALAELARQIALDEVLTLGPVAGRSRVQENQAVLEDAFEAIFGAVFLDGGIEAARRVLDQLFAIRSFNVESYVSTEENPKGALQEEIQSCGEGNLPEYEIVAIEGSPHDRTFEAVVRVRGEILGRGTGPSKKAAETEAAREALKIYRPE